MESKLQQEYENTMQKMDELCPVMDDIEEIMKNNNCSIDDILWAADFIKKSSMVDRSEDKSLYCSKCGSADCDVTCIPW